MPTYSDLTILPEQVALAEDGSQCSFTDNSGTFPATAGGFSSNGSGTATRPSRDQVNVFFIARRALSNRTWDTPYIPTTQEFTWEDPQWILPMLDGDGLPIEDADWQIVELVYPLATTWASLIELGYDFEELIENAGAYGSIVLFSNITSTNCRNNDLMDMDDADIAGGCPSELFLRVNGWYVSVSKYNELINGLAYNEILGEAAELYYFNAAKIISGILRVCAEPSCGTCCS